MRFLLLLTALLASASLHAACEVSDARALELLDRMSHSLREVSYRGVFTYEHGTSLQSLRITHSVSGNLESEEIIHLTGSGASVVRTEHPLDCIHPGHKLLRIGSRFSGDGELDCGLSSHYRLQMAGKHLVAGRAAVLLNVLPRDMYRYGYQMAIDKETGLLLKSQTVAQDGKILERFQFADLEIGDVEVDGTRVAGVQQAGHPDIHAPPASAGNSAAGEAWRLAWVPDGFMLTAGELVSVADKTYTDGLAVFSVFLEAVKQPVQPGEGRARQGGTTAYTRGMNVGGRPALVTVVGEVPMRTARMVADSIHWMTDDVD